MAPLIPSAKATLAYPLFACEFDPLDATRLFVGGGGGAGRSGVPNKIVRAPMRCILNPTSLTYAKVSSRYLKSSRVSRNR